MCVAVDERPSFWYCAAHLYRHVHSSSSSSEPNVLLYYSRVASITCVAVLFPTVGATIQGWMEVGCLSDFSDLALLGPTAVVPLWGETTQIPSSLSPKRDCSSTRIAGREFRSDQKQVLEAQNGYIQYTAAGTEKRKSNLGCTLPLLRAKRCAVFLKSNATTLA